jgi:putative sigma-54 modulation protein
MDKLNGGFMEFRAYFKHMNSSLPLFAYAEKKISEKVEKLVANAVEGHITFSVENGLHKVQFHLIAGGGLKIVMGSEDEISMYSAVDFLVDKLEKKLRRHKEKVKNHKLKPADLQLLDFNDMPEKSQMANAQALEEAVDAKYIIEFEKARNGTWMRPQATMA